MAKRQTNLSILDLKRTRFVVFSRTVHGPLLDVIYAERTRREAELRRAVWTRRLEARGVPGTRTVVVRLELAS